MQQKAEIAVSVPGSVFYTEIIARACAMISFREVTATDASALVIGASLELVAEQRRYDNYGYDHAQYDSCWRGRQRSRRSDLRERCEVGSDHLRGAEQTAMGSGLRGIGEKGCSDVRSHLHVGRGRRRDRMLAEMHEQSFWDRSYHEARPEERYCTCMLEAPWESASIVKVTVLHPFDMEAHRGEGFVGRTVSC